MGVSAAVTMDTGMFIFCACANAHIHCCLSIKWVDQGVVYPIRLSGMAQEQRCPDNRGSTVVPTTTDYTCVDDTIIHSNVSCTVMLYCTSAFTDIPNEHSNITHTHTPTTHTHTHTHTHTTPYHCHILHTFIPITHTPCTQTCVSPCI